MKLNKGVFSLLVVTVLLGLVGCSESGVISPNNNSTEISTNINNSTTIEDNSNDDISESLIRLNNAKKITVAKKLKLFNNSYSVAVDGVDFGQVTGKYIRLTGDTFTLKDNEDNELSSEKQIKRWAIKLNRLAKVYDNSGEIVGYIGEQVVKDFFKRGYTFHFYDKDKNEIGKSNEKIFSLSNKIKIYDVNDSLCYEITAKGINAGFSFIRNKYTITVHDNSTIPSDQVIFLTSILDAIKNAD